MTGSVAAAVRAGQVVQVALTLHLGQLVAKAFIVHFAIDRAFVHPCMRPVLRQVVQYAQTHPDERLVILGHTDRVGDDTYNQSLSERRVRAVFAALTYGANPTAAVAEWDQIRRSRPAGETPSIREGRGGWGTPEYQYILQDLGYYSGPVDGLHRSITDAAVRAFQMDHGLQVDGNVGNQTWLVLIDAYLAQDALAIADAQLLRNALNGCDGGSLKWLGCGEQMFLSTTPSAPCAPDIAWRPNRRVELLFVQTDHYRTMGVTAMSKDWPPPILKSYTLEKLSPAPSSTEVEEPIAKVTLRGENLFNRAIAPTVKIGEMAILDCEIMPSEQAMILYLFERPPEGGKITVSYDPEEVGELAEPFHWDAVTGDG